MVKLIQVLAMDKPTNHHHKLPKYNQVQLAAWHSGWSHEEMASHLSLVLEEKALQVRLERQFWQSLFTDQGREQLASHHRQAG